MKDLSPDQAVLVGKFGYLGLRQGRWSILGRCEPWLRDAGPMPASIRREELTGRVMRVIYDEDEPHQVVREEVLAPGADEEGPRDGSKGDGYVEKLLTTATR